MMNNNFKAFTLVEILIAMCLVAIVAVMLIPNIAQNSEKELLATQLKKAQNDVQQALLLMMAKNQGTLQAYCGGADSSACFIKELNEYLEAKVAYDNTSTELHLKGSPGESREAFCARNPVFINGKKADFKAHGGTSCNIFSAVNLKNGSTVSAQFNPACNTSGWDISAGFNSGNEYSLCGYIELDVNAEKGPNTVGKDIHYFWIIDKDGLLPLGEVDDTTRRL